MLINAFIALLAVCMTGPLERCPVTGVPPKCVVICDNYCGTHMPRRGWIEWIERRCEPMDFDGDGDVDLKDVYTAFNQISIRPSDK